MTIGYTDFMGCMALDILFCAVALDVFNIKYILSSRVGVTSECWCRGTHNEFKHSKRCGDWLAWCASRGSPVALSLVSA